MPKPTTGRIQRGPKPEAVSQTSRSEQARQRSQAESNQMMTNTLMTSVWSGVALIAATVVLAITGAIGLFAGRALADTTGAKVGLGVGLVLGTALIAVLLRRFADRIRARSTNLYRGAWIGTFASLAIILVMAYAPWLMPNYCPPGGMC